MLVILALCLLQLLHVDGCETSRDGVTWTFDDSVDELIPGVETIQECNAKCLEKESCTAFTLEEGPLNLCFLFSHPSEPINCSECRSGFVTRLVSGSGCTLDADDIIETADANSAEECLEMCADTLNCTNFLYFNSNSILRNVCLLNKGCNGTTACDDCQSGQLKCFAPNPDLPEECTNFKVLDDSTRNNQHEGSPYYCDDSDDSYPSPDWQGPGWYRIEAPAGSRIATEDPDGYHCGTGASGWTTDTHPTTPGQRKNMTVCFSYNGDECHRQTEISATNCRDFFVYNLPEAPACNDRYCGSF